MAGKHGTLRQYFRAYNRYAGTPPIPEWSDMERGQERSKRVWYPLAAVVGGVAFVPLAVVIMHLSTPTAGDITLAGSLAMLYVATAGFLSQHFAQPVSDWIEDVPRRGLAEIEFEFDTSSGRAAEVGD